MFVKFLLRVWFDNHGTLDPSRVHSRLQSLYIITRHTTLRDPKICKRFIYFFGFLSVTRKLTKRERING
jgi:hypothetical protein